MGWRGENAYDEETEATRRALPWCVRYNWGGVVIVFALIVAACLFIWLRH